MDEMAFFFGLAAVTALVIGFIVYFGLKISRAAEQQSENIGMPLYVTPVGTVVFALLVGSWACFLMIANFAPSSTFGSFLSSADGLVAALSGSMIVFVAVGVILDKFGYPIMRRNKE